MRHDPAHVWTDEEIAKLEKQIAKEYKKAHKEVSKKLDDYLATFSTKDEKWQEWVANGTKTEKEYLDWKKGQILVGKRWEDLRDSLAEDYTNAAAISQSIAKGYAPGVYAVNHNYATFEIEKGALLDTSYTLYSREAVERMYRENPRLYPKYGKTVAKNIKLGKQMAWDKRRIQSVLMQGILQGESIPNLTKRLEYVTGGDHKAAIRNARTMMTGVQNAGRIDAYDRAKSLGIPVRKQWLATLDGRTRHWHRQLDGVIADNDEPFQNEFGKIMFPGDPEADPANVYNCRCTMIAAIDGFELDLNDPSVRPFDKLGEMSYDEWLATKKSISNPIDLPETKAANIKGAWNAQYGKGGTIADPKHKYTAADGRRRMGAADDKATKPEKKFAGTGSATREAAAEDWFEYENANAMAEFIRTGKMPTTDMNGKVISEARRKKLAHEANLIQEEALTTNTGQKTLYRGMVMDEDAARALTPGETYTMDTLAAASPDRKIATIYMDVENYGGGEGVPVIFEIQKPDGIKGFKRDELETILPKGAKFRIERNYMDKDGVVHISLYAKKGNKGSSRSRSKT